jgi:hypothetical protein
MRTKIWPTRRYVGNGTYFIKEKLNFSTALIIALDSFVYQIKSFACAKLMTKHSFVKMMMMMKSLTLFSCLLGI